MAIKEHTAGHCTFLSLHIAFSNLNYIILIPAFPFLYFLICSTACGRVPFSLNDTKPWKIIRNDIINYKLFGLDITKQITQQNLVLWSALQ